MVKQLTILGVLSLLVASTKAKHSKGYFGEPISSEDIVKHKRQLTNGRRGLTEDSQRNRALKFRPTPRSATRTEHRPKTTARNGDKRHKPVFYDDDDYHRHDDDYYYAGDDYMIDDNARAPVRGMKQFGNQNGMGQRKAGMGKMGGKMGMGRLVGGNDSYKYNDFYPKVKDIAFLDDQFFDDKFFEDDDCELVSFNETFAIAGASLFLAPDTTSSETGTPSLPGTLFIFERESILDLDGTPIDGTYVSGTCTRTESGSGGAGICNFIFIDDEGYSLNANGLLVGEYESEISVTGGTGGMVGVTGKMVLYPVYEDSSDNDGDIFLDAVQYDVMAYIGLIVCPH